MLFPRVGNVQLHNLAGNVCSRGKEQRSLDKRVITTGMTNTPPTMGRTSSCAGFYKIDVRENERNYGNFLFSQQQVLPRRVSAWETLSLSLSLSLPPPVLRTC